MDLTYEYLWAAGYDLPPDPPASKVLRTDVADGLRAYAVEPPKRRGKKAAKAKRARAK